MAAAVLDAGHSLDRALSTCRDGLSGGPDRALARRLVSDVLRDLPALEWRLSHLLKKPLPRRARIVHYLLLSAIAELRSAREPAPAVVHATVEATRAAGQPGLAGLVNGVLRSYGRRADDLEAGLPDDPELVHGFPAWLVAAVRQDWPADWERILAESNRPPPTWLRVNRRRGDPATVRATLDEAGLAAECHGQLPHALRLERPVSVATLPGFAEGRVSIQDAAAQWATELMDLADGQRVLDACTAPGGKAAAMLEAADIHLTAVEQDPERLETTARGLARLGLEADLVAGDATTPEAWWDGRSFDRILIDAPCSATGVIRRHPDIRWLRRARDVDASVAVQRRLLHALWPMLKPGGILVYATCSVLAAENRSQAADFLERTADAQVVTPEPGPGQPVDPGFQILPGSDGMDGFYYLACRRLQQSG